MSAKPVKQSQKNATFFKSMKTAKSLNIATRSEEFGKRMEDTLKNPAPTKDYFCS